MSTSHEMAQTAVKAAYVKIGMVSCRTRPCETKIRCYRCLSTAHESKNCNGLDKSQCCWRCGVSGHLPFRVVTNKMHKKTSLTTDVAMDIAETLFPRRPVLEWLTCNLKRTQAIPEGHTVTVEEVGMMARRLLRNKAPGSDYVPNEILAEYAQARPKQLATLYNRCLSF